MARPERFCCEAMRRASMLDCNMHDEHSCPDVLVTWFSDGSPGISVKDGSTAHSVINFCPWCGTRLVEEQS